MSRILIAYATVVTMEGGRVFKPGWIGVESGRIAFVDRQPPGDGAWRGAETIDAAGMIALPGLINTHAHVGMTVMRGAADDLALMPWLREKIWPMESAMNPEDRYWSSRLACLEMLRGGVTAFADMSLNAESTARAAEEAGIRALVSEALLENQDEDRSTLRRALDFARDWKGSDGNRVRVGFGPHAQYTSSRPYLEAVAEAAREIDEPLQIHCCETPEEVENCRAEHGMSPIELLDEVGLFARPAIAAHCIHLGDRDREIMAERRVTAAHNPSSNMKLGNGVMDAAALTRAGVNLALGTDSTASNNNLSMFMEMRHAALLQKSATGDPTVLPAAEVLEMATTGGALAMGLEGRCGRLAPGYEADIVLLRTDGLHARPVNDAVSHLVYALGASDVDRVMIAGETILEGGCFRNLDTGEVLARCGEIASRISVRAS